MIEMMKSPEIIRAPKLFEQVAQLLVDEIKTGTFSEGDKLPSEASLVDRFDVSRTVIREAISCLEFDGYIQVRRGARAVITNPSARKAFRIDQPVHSEKEKLQQFFELYTRIEGLAAELSAKRRQKKDLLALEKCMDDMKYFSDHERGPKGVAANVEFHVLIAEASKNIYLRDLMMFLKNKLTMMMRLDQKKVHRSNLIQTIHDEHYAIYEAIRDKRPQKAKRLIEEHFQNAALRNGIELSFQ